MSKLIRPKPDYGEAKEIGGWIKKTKDGELRTRFLCIKLLMEGRSQQEVCQILEISRRKARLLVKRWNEEGKEGLLDKRANNSRPAKKAKWVEEEASAVISSITEKEAIKGGKAVRYVVIHGQLKKKEKK